jgi:UDP-glucose 4-epimerase
VYGEASQVPTPEDYGPCVPISTYGGSKLACEALITSYLHTFNHKGLILRLANIIGPRSKHGVIYDFITKLLKNSEELEILGDGRQEKSYLYITDLISALMHLTEHYLESRGKTAIYNVGSKDKITVKEIAGWKGDVKNMQLSIQKIVDSGWKPKYSSKQAVELAVQGLKREFSKNKRF